ncbi:MAG: hypothetical protein ABIQ66_09940 [Novosphingobium sp.]
MTTSGHAVAACDPRYARDASPPRIALVGAGMFNGILSRQALKKGWPVTAVLNRAGEKIGKDWGPMTGLKQDIGLAVQDFAAVHPDTLDADIAVVAIGDRLSENLPVYRKLLGAGIDILCLGCESYFPHASNRDAAQEIDALAKANGATFTGTGTWDFSRIWPGIVMAGFTMSLERLHHASVTDFGREATYPKFVGIGLTPGEFRAALGTTVDVAQTASYHLILQCVLHALGYDIADVSQNSEPVVLDHPIYCKGWDKWIEPGLSTGLRKHISVSTRQGVVATAQIDLRLVEPNERETMTWSIDGNPGVDFAVERRNNTAIATGACMLNRIPDILAAPPGIQTIMQLGPLKSTSLI